MPKHIVLCSDGTGNSGGKGNDTNVWRIYKSVDLRGYKANPDNPPNEQRAFYDDGVGTERMKLPRLFCGAFGFGLSRNVRQLYARLVVNFEPGDNIYLFGFSRGAFTVRTLAGFITACGIIDKRHCPDDETLHRLVKKAYRAYRRRYAAAITKAWFRLERRFGIERPTAEAFRQRYGVQVTPEQYLDHGRVRDNFSAACIVPIRFMGVWDTVDAVGFPVRRVAAFWNRVIYQFKFPNHRLSPWVHKACHALAIDEERSAFHPLLFNQRGEVDGERIEQVWFPGVHSNVGGGYPKQGMAHVTLNWMMARAAAEGLRFNAHYREAYLAAANGQDKLYDSRAGVSIYYSYRQRDIQELCRQEEVQPIRVHVSTFHRILARTEDYAPGNLAPFQAAVDDEAHIGETPADRKRLAETCNKGWAGDRHRDYDQSLLAGIRQSLHWCYALAGFALVVAAYLLNTRAPVEAPANILLTTGGLLCALLPHLGGWLYETIVLPLFSRLVLGLLIVLLPLGLYIVDSMLENLMQCRYQRFWRRTLPTPWWQVE